MYDTAAEQRQVLREHTHRLKPLDLQDQAVEIETQGYAVRDPFPPYGMNLTTIWALEDFTPDSGPILITPGTNRLRRTRPAIR